MSLTSDHRSALSTALGIVLSFALGFAAQWAIADGPWRAWHVMPGAMLAAGVVVLTVALAGALLLEDNHASGYRRIVICFVTGVALTFCGFALTVILEARQQWYVGPRVEFVAAEFRHRSPKNSVREVVRIPVEETPTYVISYVTPEGKREATTMSFIEGKTGWVIGP